VRGLLPDAVEDEEASSPKQLPMNDAA
jgi:hypothetical protein